MLSYKKPCDFHLLPLLRRCLSIDPNTLFCSVYPIECTELGFIGFLLLCGGRCCMLGCMLRADCLHRVLEGSRISVNDVHELRALMGLCRWGRMQFQALVFYTSFAQVATKRSYPTLEGFGASFVFCSAGHVGERLFLVVIKTLCFLLSLIVR